jgi:glucokinase
MHGRSGDVLFRLRRRGREPRPQGHGHRRGLYVGGGIAPKTIWKLKDGVFMDAFRGKGRFSEMMDEIPVKVIMNDKTALLGGLSHAMDLLNVP